MCTTTTTKLTIWQIIDVDDTCAYCQTDSPSRLPYTVGQNVSAAKARICMQGNNLKLVSCKLIKMLFH